jgi:hypothetical protein
LYGDFATAQPVAKLSDLTITSLAVEADPDPGKFTVIDARMDETATAAVLFGLVGATINSAQNASEDEAKAAPLMPVATSLDMKALITKAIIDRLTERQALPLSPDRESASHTLVVDLGEWGLIRRSQGDVLMRTFLNINVVVENAKGRKLYGPERSRSIGGREEPLNMYTPEVFKADMEELALKAGREIANKIIYR